MTWFDLFFRKDPTNERATITEGLVHQKYQTFKRLLAANNQSLHLISDLENFIYQDRPFSLYAFRQKAEALFREVHSITEDLNALWSVKFPELFDVLEKLGSRIQVDLHPRVTRDETRLVLQLEQLSQEDVHAVGGKAANLGEVFNRTGLPVPPTFAVTAYACERFLEHNGLNEEIEALLGPLDVNHTEELMRLSAMIRKRIEAAELPEDLAAAIRQAVSRLKARLGPDFRVAVRSSATSEDSEASFAGQHSTVLNVREANVIQAYKEVVASTFNPRAIFYRRSRGYRDQDVIMSVAVVAMIDARSSGVIYTVDPNDSRNAVIMISSVWGLAAGAVDGSADADFFLVNKQTLALESSVIEEKGTMLRPDPQLGTVELPVPRELLDAPSLSQEQILELSRAALRLEAHYGYALDIEWAIDQAGRLAILQARPLGRSQRYGAAEGVGPRASTDQAPVEVPEEQAILRGGAAAAEGTASGIAYVLKSDHMLHHIPSGAIVVVQQTSPRYVPLMGRVRGIVTDIGSVTGHMASVAREFRIPTLVGTGSGTRQIPHGEEITLDTANGVVYRGRIEALLSETRPINPMKDSPVYNMGRTALKRIAPLNLIDPKAEDFSPAGCQTLHDIIRFAHEMAMQAMFQIHKDFRSEKRVAIPLRIYLPVNIMVIDLGGGLSVTPGAKQAMIEQVSCVPLQALISGMKHPDVDWSHDVGVNLGGLATIFAESILRDPTLDGRMGAPNYALIARRYLNLNSRLGYHYATIDTFCGEQVNDNYITFDFKGGAADIGRRSRRARLIAQILKQLGFKVTLNGDLVRGELKKYNAPTLCSKLDIIGRMLGSVRLLDMLLSEDRMIDWYVDQFMAGNYTFKATKPESVPTPPAADGASP